MTSRPYVAIICTAERLPLRDDPPGPNQRLFFNLNLSTAVVQNGASNDVTWTFIDQNRQLLAMWSQQLDVQNGNVIFSVFAIGHASPPHISSVAGSAAAVAPDPACALCGQRLSDELDALINLGDLTLLVWDPANPSAASSSPNTSSTKKASIYRPVAWHDTVAHASTWPKPIPQGLNLSFEVGIPNSALNNVDSVVIFPRFVNTAVAAVNETATTPNWQSYEGQYLTDGSPQESQDLWAYQASCPVDETDSGLIDMKTYWVTRDPAVAADGTSNWRQSLETTIASRFDYFPRLLNILEDQFDSNGTASPVLDAPMWDLGLRMLEDLSDFGDRTSLEGSTLQQALILRAVEAAIDSPENNVPTNANEIADAIVAGLQCHDGQWQREMSTMLQDVDQRLASAIASSSSSPPPTPELVIATLRQLYAALSNDDNLAKFLLTWWDDAIQQGPVHLSPSAADKWPQIKGQLSGKILPRGQLHKRYLSAVAANAHPSPGVNAPAIQAALGTNFTGRIGHTASLIPSWKQMLVFAGDPGTGPLNDLWMMGVANNSAQPWSQVLPVGTPPAPRTGHTAAFDDRVKQLLVFGGLVQGIHADDLWRLTFPQSTTSVWTSNAVWTSLLPRGAPPPPRTGHSAIYVPAPELSPPGSPPEYPATMIIFGGDVADVGSPPVSGPSNDVWLLENATDAQPAWSPLQIAPGAAPAKRKFHTAVYDANSNDMIVFGGATAGGLANDVWILSNADGTGGLATWSPLAVVGSLPPARSNHSAIYDAAAQRMVVFGGQGSNAALSDVWMLSFSGRGGAAWTQMAPTGAIPAREGHSAIYNPPKIASPPERAGIMIVFSGGPDPIADVWALSDPFGSPAWSRLNPSGNPQLDAAVKAAIRGWVYRSASTWPSRLREELDAFVAADLSVPQSGLATVADDSPAPTQRPHALVVQVGGWDDSGQDTPDEDLRRVAGFGLLIRKQGSSPPSPWRCVNAANVTVRSQDSPNHECVLPDKFVPIRLHYRSGMKDPFIDYDNQPKIAKSAATGLAGQFKQKTNLGIWANSVPLFSYSHASGTYKSIYGLVFGTTYECAPFAIGHGGAMPTEIENALAGSPPGEIDFEDPGDAVIRRMPYYRRVPVGHLRVLPFLPSGAVTSGAWSPNALDAPFNWPQIPSTVYPLARDLGLTRDGGTGSTGDQLPFLLMPLKSDFSFNIQAPTTDINTWDRWVADDSTYKDNQDTTNTRKAVWAAFHRECAAVGQASPSVANVGSNRIGDPAVAALLFRVEKYNLTGWTPKAPNGAWTVVAPDAGTNPVQLMSFQSVPSSPNTSDSSEAWQAVWAAPVPITIAQSTDGLFHLAAGASGGYTILVPPMPVSAGSPPSVETSNIARLTVTALVKESDFDQRFEPNIFVKTERLTLSGTSYVSVGVDEDSFPSFSMLIERPSIESMNGVNAEIYDALALDFEPGGRVLKPSINNLLEKFPTVGNFEIRRQDWRWSGRPLPPLTPLPWQPSTVYLRGDSVQGPGSPRDREECIQAGASGTATPAWSDSTHDGSVIWANQGPWGEKYWEDLAFADRPLSDYRISYKRFNLGGHDGLALADIDLSNDLRCQYIRFCVLGHNRYEGLVQTTASSTPTSPWKGTCVPRADAMPKPPKPTVRLVVPITQRGVPSLSEGSPSDSQDAAFDLLVIAPEAWYRIGGLGETLTAQVQPVLGSKIATILFDGSPPTQIEIEVDRFGGDNGVTYLDTQLPLAFVPQTSPPSRLPAGTYSFVHYLSSPSNPVASYLFSPDDAGTNVAISYRELDQSGQQHYEHGPDQIVDGSSATTAVPLVSLQPVGATLDDLTIQAPNFSNTYFMGSVDNDPETVTAWRQLKIQFRRELRPYGGSEVPAAVSDWTDAMWVETVPDSATFRTAAGGRVRCEKISVTWSPSVSSPSLGPLVVTPALAVSDPGTTRSSSAKFELWYVVTQQITDAAGNMAEVYVASVGGTPADPLFELASGSQYLLRIVEVQKVAGSTFSNDNAFNVLMNPASGVTLASDATLGSDEIGRIVRISPRMPIEIK
jgi:hypothetical protein